MFVLVQVFLGVNQIGRVRRKVEKRGPGVLQVEDDGIFVRRLNALNHLEQTFTSADRPLRPHDPIPAGLDIRRGQLFAFVKLHALMELEGVRRFILRSGPGLSEIADDLGKPVRVKPHQGVVTRRHRDQYLERTFLVHIQARWIAGDSDPQDAAVFRFFSGQYR